MHNEIAAVGLKQELADIVPLAFDQLGTLKIIMPAFANDTAAIVRWWEHDAISHASSAQAQIVQPVYYSPLLCEGETFDS